MLKFIDWSNLSVFESYRFPFVINWNVSANENIRKNYPSDLTDEQWEMIADDIPPSPGGERKRTTNMREIVDALLHISKTGCQWAYLPHDYPPEGTVRMYFRKWQDAGVLEKICDKLRRKARVAENHEPEPSVLIVDS